MITLIPNYTMLRGSFILLCARETRCLGGEDGLVFGVQGQLLSCSKLFFSGGLSTDLGVHASLGEETAGPCSYPTFLWVSSLLSS